MKRLTVPAGMPDAGHSAWRVALRRAAHQVFDEPVVLRDPYAVALLGAAGAEALRRTPAAQKRVWSKSLRAFVVARAAYAEACLADAYARGVRQYCLLGAGLDTFALRNPWPDLRVFEVDQPVVQQWKGVLARAAGLEYGGRCEQVGEDFEAEAVLEVSPEAGPEVSPEANPEFSPKVSAEAGLKAEFEAGLRSELDAADLQAGFTTEPARAFSSKPGLSMDRDLSSGARPALNANANASADPGFHLSADAHPGLGSASEQTLHSGTESCGVLKTETLAEQHAAAEPSRAAGVRVPGVRRLRSSAAMELPSQGGGTWPPGTMREGEPAFFAMLGVAPFLHPKTLRAVLQRIRRFAPGSAVVFDYRLHRDALDAEEQQQYDSLQKRATAKGEPFREGWTPEAMAWELRDFRGAEDLGREALNRLYFHDRVDGLAVRGAAARLVLARV